MSLSLTRSFSLFLSFSISFSFTHHIGGGLQQAKHGDCRFFSSRPQFATASTRRSDSNSRFVSKSQGNRLSCDDFLYIFSTQINGSAFAAQNVRKFRSSTHERSRKTRMFPCLFRTLADETGKNCFVLRSLMSFHDNLTKTRSKVLTARQLHFQQVAASRDVRTLRAGCA